MTELALAAARGNARATARTWPRAVADLEHIERGDRYNRGFEDLLE